MSNSRLEKFIYAICSMEVSDLPAPLSRIEILWNCLITGETPDFEPQSRNEQYLMAMLGLYELENLPAPMSRGEKLLYKIAMGETDLSDIPAYLSRYEELLGYLAENGGVGDFEYILQTLNQRLSTLYSTKERPMKQAVIKGDTLVNELPRPSLKNTMSNVESQKLNHGYDNGKTLVNIHPANYNISSASNFTFYAYADVDRNYIKANTKYIIRLYDTHEYVNAIYFKPCVVNRVDILSINNKYAIFTTKETLSDSDFSNNKIHFYSNIAITLDDVKNTKILVCEYQDGMENWDIPYFEGTKTFSATPNVVDGEFKSAILSGNTLINSLGISNVFVPANTESTVNLGLQTTLPPKKYILFYNVVTENTSPNEPLNRHTPRINLKDGSSLFQGYEGFNTKTGRKYWIFTANSDIVDVYYWVKNISTDVTVNNCMLLEYQEGMENWDIPYFEGMQSVQLSEVTTENVKNLINKQTMQRGYIDEGGTLQSNNTDLASDYIKITPNTYYTYQVSSNIGSTMRFSFFDKSKNLVARTTALNASAGKYATYMTPSNACYLRTHSNNFNNIGFNPDLISLVMGDKPLSSYEYQSNTLTLAEPLNLRKVGDVEDEFDVLTGQVTERVSEVVLDGSESWKVNGDRKTVVSYICNSVVGSLNANNIKCSEFPTRTDGGTNDVEMIRLSSTSGKIIIHILKSKIGINNDTTVSNGDDTTKFKQWLSNNPITVQYELATESTKTVNTTITDQDGVTQTKLHSFNDGYLSVSSQGLLPSAINYEVPTNNSYYLPDMLTLGAQYTSRGSADCNATIDGKLLALGKNRTFTTPSSVTDRLMVLDTAVDDLMFIKGDQTAKDFGYFEGMKSVGLSNKMPVLTTTGKNLYDGELQEGGWSTSTGLFNEFKESVCSINPIKVQEDTYLRLSQYGEVTYNGVILFFCYDVNNKYLGYIDNGEQVLKNTDYVHFRIYDANSTSQEVNPNIKIQVEASSISTSYEPFKTNILTVNEDIELRGIGDVRDELNCLTGELIQNIGEVVLDGNGFYVESQDDLTFTFTKDGNPVILQANKFLSNRFSNVIYVNGTIRVIVNKSEFKSIDDFKENLLTNNLIILFAKSQKSIKTVDLTAVDQDGQPTKLKTFNDITYVEIKADNLIPSVDLEVATKISETLSTMGLQHLDISETQNKLGQTIDEQTENTDATMMATTEIYENL